MSSLWDKVRILLTLSRANLIFFFNDFRERERGRESESGGREYQFIVPLVYASIG